MGFDSGGTRAGDQRIADRNGVATAQQKTVLVAALVNVKPHQFTGSVDAPSLSEARACPCSQEDEHARFVARYVDALASR
jgi:hypothetical protein